MPRALINKEQSATMNDGSNGSGDLSLSCSVSSIKGEESEVSEVEGDLETVELYQFEPLASNSSAKSNRQKMTTLESNTDSAADW